MFWEEIKQTMHNFVHFLLFMVVGLMVALLAIGEAYGLLALGLEKAPKLVEWLFGAFLMFQVLVGMLIVVFGTVQFFLSRARTLYLEFVKRPDQPIEQKQADVPFTMDH